ncbi:HSP20 family protein [Halobellus clavatus]|jgi:HSP20 family protein|uniref:HSP20 family protein n=2 Tax=Halobellus clavatus TaxID=660517 RepID=A0A1H3DPW1_9EURY|nr:Hsp20/alpha crystallin family protein [Halobellus clavatus]SDX68128.1 HSP20 family protein [Halobellus clavatus]
MMKRSPSFDEFAFEDLFARMSRQFEEMSSQLDGPRSPSREMAIDLRDESESLVAVVDLPGYANDDIDVSIDDQLLTVAAVRESAEMDEDDRYVHRERRSTSVRRSIRLPCDVRADDASAAYNNGVLTVTLPKRVVDDDDAHRIDVE